MLLLDEPLTSPTQRKAWHERHRALQRHDLGPILVRPEVSTYPLTHRYDAAAPAAIDATVANLKDSEGLGERDAFDRERA